MPRGRRGLVAVFSLTARPPRPPARICAARHRDLLDWRLREAIYGMLNGTAVARSRPRAHGARARPGLPGESYLDVVARLELSTTCPRYADQRSR